MKVLLLAAAALLLGCGGAALFRLAPAAPAGQEAARPPAPPIALLAAMFACQLGLAVMLPCFYGRPALDTLKTLALCTLLWPCGWIDYKTYLIPNRLLLAGLAGRAALLAAELLAAPGQAGAVVGGALAAAGALVLAAGLCRLLAPGSVGLGDLKLLGIMGLYLGAEGVWSTMLFSLLLSFAVSVALLALKRANRRTELPFAPFLLAGRVLAAFLTGI